MGWIFDDDGAKAARERREKDAEEALKKYKSGKGKSGKLLSWGDSGRSETKPGLFGLGTRVAKDAEQENAKSGYYGFFGAKHVTNKAKDAKKGGWFS